jgi:hypothetical protein
LYGLRSVAVSKRELYRLNCIFVEPSFKRKQSWFTSYQKLITESEVKCANSGFVNRLTGRTDWQIVQLVHIKGVCNHWNRYSGGVWQVFCCKVHVCTDVKLLPKNTKCEGKAPKKH